MFTNLLIGKASGPKLNKNKTFKGLWLGAWKDRKDNYRFSIDFVKFIKKKMVLNLCCIVSSKICYIDSGLHMSKQYICNF